MYKIISLNVRGLRDNCKRRNIFNYYRSRGEIICLQETHSTLQDEIIWTNEWGGRILFSHGNSNARGVCILFPKMDININDYQKDEAGRILSCKLEKNDQKINLCCIYAPNDDSPSFYLQVVKMLYEELENKVIIGDFNLVLNPEFDRIGTTHKRSKSVEILNSIMQELYLVDVWRAYNENVRRYTWFRTKPKLVASRIDFALISQGMVDLCKNICFIPGAFSDHTAIFLYLELCKQDRGPGYWKFNAKLLQDTEFIEEINIFLEHLVDNTKHMYIVDRWEYCKRKIASQIKEFSKTKSSEKQLIISQLSEKIIEMEEKIQRDEAKDVKLAELMLKTKADMEEIMSERIKGVMFRSKCKYYEYGEKSSKYFFGLEKTRYNAKTCHQLYNSEGAIVEGSTEILKLLHAYYAKLYQEDEDVKFELENVYNVRISKETYEKQTKEITYTEVACAAKQLKNESCPGFDGISIDFIKFFWKYLGEIIYELVIEVTNRKKLHESALLGIINVIPKPQKNSKILANLRPITLLDSDYKIVEKIIANRMMDGLEEIIHENQQGFMPNRRAAVNIRRMFEIISLTEREKIDGAILSLDFEKCFDKISFSAIFGALEFFGFADNIIEWVRTIYIGFRARIQNSGFFSEDIEIMKGVHQGGPVSSLLFLCCAEVLALTIRNDEQIKGIPVKEIRELLGQYADNADMYLLHEEKNVKKVFEVLERFKRHTGFCLNYNKTTIMRIGSLKDSDAQIYTGKPIAWTNKPINVLGVWVGTDVKECLHKNYEQMVEKTKNITVTWKDRSLSLFGKISIINTLIASLFVYKMTVLPNIPVQIIKEIEAEIEKFIWNGAKPKIPLRELQYAKAKGGLNLVNLQWREWALKISWIKILSQNTNLAELVYYNMKNVLKHRIWECNLSINIIETINPDQFWKDVLIAWTKYKNIINIPTPSEYQIIWWNEEIKINQNSICWIKCIERNLIYTKQLYDNGKMISLKVAMDKFHLTLMEFNSLVSAIPKLWKKEIRDNGEKATTPNTTLYEKCLQKPNLSQHVYQSFQKNTEVQLERKKQKWELELGKEMEETQYVECFKDIYSVTNVPKLRSFQYRLWHRAVITNVHLYRWGKISNNLCSFCQKNAETYVHLFITCSEVRKIWLEMEIFMEAFSKAKIHFDVDTVMVNRLIDSPKGHIKNFICLVIKQYIYRQRCLGKTLSSEELKYYILSIANTEKYIATKNNKLAKHERKWFPDKGDKIVSTSVDQTYIQQYIHEI